MNKYSLILSLFAALVGSNAFAASGFTNSGIQVQEYVYDFAVDGGATGAHELSTKAGAHAIPANAIVKEVTAYVVTSVTSASNASVEWGNTGDTDGYSGAAITKTTLAAGYAKNAQQGVGALLWDNTNDNQIAYVPASSDRNFEVYINEHALTAGKIVFMVEYLQPKQ